MAFWNRRKAINAVESLESHRQLKRTLGWPHLVALGVGAIVGTGIYTLIGVGAGKAGPAVILSFVVAGVVCACAALAYAEMATMIPAAGSAYTYTYTVAGELLAWIIGWSLILEYSLVVSAVAVGWSGYAVGFLTSIGIDLPLTLTAGMHVEGGMINLPAVLIIMAVAGLLMLGTRESATVNAVLVVVKLVALVIFIGLALTAFNADHFTPFMPFGFAAQESNGVVTGVMAAAAIIFFAFYGFDAVSTAAEETVNPEKNLARGIVGSMVVCTILYMAVAAAALGAMYYTNFSSSPEPLAHILRTLGHPFAATLIAGAAILALPTVLLAFLYGQSRIFFVMSRDGLLPEGLARVNQRSGSPVTITLVTAVIVSIIAALFPLDEIAGLANAGTLAAFVAVAACMLVMRVRDPNRPRVFRTPWAWPVGSVAIAGCIYLFTSLPTANQWRFLIWNGIGVVVYLIYGMHKSRLARAGA